MKLSFLAALAALLLASSVRADEASHLAAATQVFDLTSSKEALRANFLSGVSPMLERMATNGIPASVIDEIRKAVGDFFDKQIDFQEIRTKSAEIYKSEFSEDDLKGLVAFYNSPLGKKVVEKTPVIAQKTAQFAQQQLAVKGPELQKTIGEIIQKKLPNLGMRPPGGAGPLAPHGAAPSAPAPTPAPPAGPSNSAK